MKKLIPIALSALPLAAAAQTTALPNVVWIMADDLGIGDLGCYGQRIIETPHIDSLAAHGMKFMQHYSGSTVSAPSRCSLLTGYHMGHAQIRANAKVPGSDGLLYETPLDSSAVTVADLFKQRGYATACCGKWGLGGPGTVGEPLRHGFDYFYGYLGQRFAHNYYPEFLHENDEKVMLNGKAYSHDLIRDHALQFVRSHADAPFFLYFSPTIPHADLDVLETEKEHYEGRFCETPFVGNPNGYKSQDEPRATYAAMVSYLDKSVGDIVALLEEIGVADNTIVIFTSDNGVHAEGGHDPYYFDSNGPYRGTKRDLYEGGVRTPFVISWPNRIAEGVVTDHVAAFWDFMPTVAELIGVDAPDGIDGISYLPTLLGREGQQEHDGIYYEFYEQGGKQSYLSADGWKLIRLQTQTPAATYEELYNLSVDPAETTNLIHQYPDIAARLRLYLDAQHTPME